MENYLILVENKENGIVKNIIKNRFPDRLPNEYVCESENDAFACMKKHPDKTFNVLFVIYPEDMTDEDPGLIDYAVNTSLLHVISRNRTKIRKITDIPNFTDIFPVKFAPNHHAFCSNIERLVYDILYGDPYENKGIHCVR